MHVRHAQFNRKSDIFGLQIGSFQDRSFPAAGQRERRRWVRGCMASRDKVDVDTFHKGIQYALEKLGKSKFGFERTAVSNFKSKRHEGSGKELVDYSRAPCLGADL